MSLCFKHFQKTCLEVNDKRFKMPVDNALYKNPLLLFVNATGGAILTSPQSKRSSAIPDGPLPVTTHQHQAVDPLKKTTRQGLSNNRVFDNNFLCSLKLVLGSVFDNITL